MTLAEDRARAQREWEKAQAGIARHDAEFDKQQQQQQKGGKP